MPADCKRNDALFLTKTKKAAPFEAAFANTIAQSLFHDLYHFERHADY